MCMTMRSSDFGFLYATIDKLISLISSRVSLENELKRFEGTVFLNVIFSCSTNFIWTKLVTTSCLFSQIHIKRQFNSSIVIHC